MNKQLNKIITSVLVILLCTNLIGQNSKSFMYQGLIQENDATFEGLFQIFISIEEDGDIVYSEEHISSTNNLGVFNIEIGNGNNSFGDFNAIDWSKYNHELVVSVDLEGNNSSIEVGRSKLAAVPFAIYGEDNDSNPTNEIQTLSKQGNTISLSENGGTIIDEVDDNDSNPTNEIQTLSKQGNTISLSNSGGVVDLSYLSTWSNNNEGIYFNEGIVGIGTDNPSHFLHVNSIGINSTLRLTHENGFDQAKLNFGDGDFVFLNESNDDELTIHSNRLILDNPTILLRDSDDTFGSIQKLSDGQGFFELQGQNGNDNIRLSTLLGYPNNGFVSTSNSDGIYTSGLFSGVEGGTLRLRDNNGVSQVVMTVAASKGIIFADEISAQIKNFRMDDPLDESKEIWYACIEGPEAAAYERGTSTLVNGEIFVPFSDHFKKVINSETLTIQITPRYWDTYGIAVIEQTSDGFIVKELKGGNGEFDFHWIATAVRSGYEDYKVMRNKNQSPNFDNDSNKEELPKVFKHIDNDGSEPAKSKVKTN